MKLYVSSSSPLFLRSPPADIHPFCLWKDSPDSQKRRERDHLIRDKILQSMGFDREGREGDAY